MLPFLSQRYAVRAAQLIANTPAENVGAYDQLVRDILEQPDRSVLRTRP